MVVLICDHHLLISHLNLYQARAISATEKMVLEFEGTI